MGTINKAPDIQESPGHMRAPLNSTSGHQKCTPLPQRETADPVRPRDRSAYEGADRVRLDGHTDDAHETQHSPQLWHYPA